MAYNSTTFGDNPAFLTVPKLGGGPLGGAVWGYTSTHTMAAVAASSFFSDGARLGMKPGDVINATQVTTAFAWTAHATGRVTVVTAGAGATVVFAATST
jgi:hypothetical protein